MEPEVPGNLAWGLECVVSYLTATLFGLVGGWLVAFVVNLGLIAHGPKVLASDIFRCAGGTNLS